MTQHAVLGTGAVGLAVVDELLRQDEAVWVVNRSGRAPVNGVEVRAGDILDRSFAKDAVRDADVVYFCVNPPYHKWGELFGAMQDATVEAAASAGAKVVAMENLYMYGRNQSSVLTEDHPIEPHTHKGRVRADMARRLMDAHAAGRIRATAGRASDFFGPRVTAVVNLFGPIIAGRRGRALGNVNVSHTYTYIRDVGRALVVLGTDDRADGRAWHLPNPETVTTAEFCRRIGRAAGTDGNVVGAPKGAIRLVGLFNKDAKELVEMFYEFEEPWVVDSTDFERTFEMPATPLDEAIAETVAWCRAHPEE